MAINNKGEVVGFSDLSGDGSGTPNFHAFLWTKSSGMKDLGTLPGDAYSEALGINRSGPDRRRFLRGQLLDVARFYLGERQDDRP